MSWHMSAQGLICSGICQKWSDINRNFKFCLVHMSDQSGNCTGQN